MATATTIMMMKRVKILINVTYFLIYINKIYVADELPIFIRVFSAPLASIIGNCNLLIFLLLTGLAREQIIR